MQVVVGNVSRHLTASLIFSADGQDLCVFEPDQHGLNLIANDIHEIQSVALVRQVFCDEVEHVIGLPLAIHFLLEFKMRCLLKTQHERQFLTKAQLDNDAGFLIPIDP